jgi:hypothetical protein
MKKLATLIILFNIFTSCSQKESESKLQKMKWVLGNWKYSSADGDMYENWTKVNDSLYSAESFMIVNHDTVFAETISLRQTQQVLLYIPSVRDQNNGKPVSFTLTSDVDNTFTFSNPNHDFPQRIIYSNPHPDTLHAIVEGLEEGKFRKEEFVMARINN